MNHIKTLEQIEFADLFSKLRAKGLRAADVARELKMSSAGVSMLLKGERSPRPLTLDALRNYVERVCGPEPVAALKEDSVPYSIEARLAALPENERREVLDIFNVLVNQAAQRVDYKKKSAKRGARGAGGDLTS